MMKMRLLIPLLGVLGPVAVVHAATDNPYQPIVVRNIFNLQPIPPPKPPETKEPEAPTKIIANGITTILGRVQVLFKAQTPAKGAQPAREQSYVMTEGERQDDIEVQKIDQANATITFNNHGIIQTLELEKATLGGGGTPPGGPGPGGAPAMPNQPGGPANRPPGGNPAGATAIGNHFARNRTPGGAAGATSPTSANSSNSEVNERGIYQPSAASDQLTAEQRVILIEAQRADENYPYSQLLPPTAITKDVTGDGN